MAMTREQAARYTAVRLLALAASSRGGETLDELATALGIGTCPSQRAPVRLAQRYLAASTDAGSWREARAEAEARLRTEGP